MPVSFFRADGLMTLHNLGRFPSLPISETYKIAVRISSMRACAVALMRGGGTAVGRLVGSRVTVGVRLDVEGLGVHANEVDVVSGEFTVAVFVVTCMLVNIVLQRMYRKTPVFGSLLSLQE